MCGLRYNRGAERISASAVSAGIRIGLIGLPQTSPLHWLRVVGLLITLMLTGAGWDQTEARSPRNDPPKARGPRAQLSPAVCGHRGR